MKYKHKSKFKYLVIYRVSKTTCIEQIKTRRIYDNQTDAVESIKRMLPWAKVLYTFKIKPK